TRRWISGLWTKCTCSSQDRAAACGFRRRPKIPPCIIIRRGRAWAILPPCVCGMARFCFAARPEDATERPSGNSLKCFGETSAVPGRRVLAIRDNARVWKLTRRLCFHNRYFCLLDGVVAAVEGQFAQWTKPNDALRQLCAIT